MENYFKKICLGILCLTAIHSTTYANTPLSAPWYLLQAELKETLKTDACVQVSNIEGDGREMKINISVCEYNKALALATFLNKEIIFGDQLALTVQVYAPADVPVNEELPKTAQEVAQVLNTALSGNERFVKTFFNEKKKTVTVEFKPVVVQYFSDDLSDAYLNTNIVAATAFREVFGFEPLSDDSVAPVNIFVTTSPM